MKPVRRDPVSSRHGAAEPQDGGDSDARGGSPDATLAAELTETPRNYSTDYSGRHKSRRRHRRSRSRRAVTVLLISGLVLTGCAVGAFLYLTDRYLGNIDRIADPFADLDEGERPAPSTSDGQDPPLTFLLVGADSRDPLETGPPGERSDVIMLMRITGQRELVQFVSLPRDSWVPIPDHGLGKLNSSYALGGPALLIRTVEALTDVRIDHFAAVDFSGFREITDALGGVNVRVAETTSYAGVTFTKGLNHLDGGQALVYVRQRDGLPGADLDHLQRQQNYLRAVLRTVFQQNLLGDLGKTDDLLLALTSAISVDETLSDTDLFGLAYSLRDLTRNSLVFLSVPVAGRGQEGAESVAYLDTGLAAPIWGYLKDDTLADHLTEFEQELLPEIPH